MKDTNICPKCGSNDIVVVEGYTNSYGAGNNIMLGHTIFSSVSVNRYICCNCGFTEEWIERDKLQKVKNSNMAHKNRTNK